MRRELRFELVDCMWKLAENAALHRAVSTCDALSKRPHDCGDELMADHVPLLFRGSESAESGDEAGGRSSSRAYRLPHVSRFGSRCGYLG